MYEVDRNVTLACAATLILLGSSYLLYCFLTDPTTPWTQSGNAFNCRNNLLPLSDHSIIRLFKLLEQGHSADFRSVLCAALGLHASLPVRDLTGIRYAIIVPARPKTALMVMTGNDIMPRTLGDTQRNMKVMLADTMALMRYGVLLESVKVLKALVIERGGDVKTIIHRHRHRDEARLRGIFHDPEIDQVIVFPDVIHLKVFEEFNASLVGFSEMVESLKEEWGV